jgi:F-type H+-transporting ATPase subunit b
MPPILQLDIQQIVSQAISFLLLLWILKRFAWKPLLAVLEARRRQIEEAFQQSAKTRQELAQLQEDYTRRLAAIDQEARLKIQQSVLEAKRIAGEIQEQARAQASAIIQKSKETVDMELAKAKVTLRDEVADMTVEAVEKILQQKLDPQTDRRLVEAALEELERRPARR